VDRARIMRALPARRYFARQILVLDKCTSTSDYLKSVSKEDHPPDLVIALEQESGRGRKARDWWSGPPNENLSFTLRVEPPEPALAGGLLCACALAATCEHFSKQASALKWPNDVLLHTPTQGLAKVSGLLSEMPADGKDLLIGIGVNLNTAPPKDIADYATCKVAANNCAISREAFMVRFLWELEKRWRAHILVGASALENEFLGRLRQWAPNGVYAPDDATMPSGRLVEFSIRDGLKWGNSNPRQFPLGMLPSIAKLPKPCND